MQPIERTHSDAALLRVVLGTATQGGGFQLFGQNLAETVNAVDPGLTVEAIATRDSCQNLSLLEQGEIDISLVEGNAAPRVRHLNAQAIVFIGSVLKTLHYTTTA